MNTRPLALAGMLALVGVARPVLAAGHAPSQASTALGVAALAGKYDGAGITIGVIAGSFDSAGYDCGGLCEINTPAQDVAAGNLPGLGNPNGDTTPVVVVSDADFKDDSNMGPHHAAGHLRHRTQGKALIRQRRNRLVRRRPRQPHQRHRALPGQRHHRRLIRRRRLRDLRR